MPGYQPSSAAQILKISLNQFRPGFGGIDCSVLKFEVLKHRPHPLMPSPRTPYRFFRKYSLECYTPADLQRYYHDPIEFLEKHRQ